MRRGKQKYMNLLKRHQTPRNIFGGNHPDPMMKEITHSWNPSGNAKHLRQPSLKVKDSDKVPNSHTQGLHKERSTSKWREACTIAMEDCGRHIPKLHLRDRLSKMKKTAFIMGLNGSANVSLQSITQPGAAQIEFLASNQRYQSRNKSVDCRCKHSPILGKKFFFKL